MNMFDDDLDWFFNKKKRKSLFFDIMEEFKRMDDMMDKLFKESWKDFENIKPGKSYVYGFSIKIGPDGKPIVQEFGNFKPEEERLELSEEREPITDVIDHGDSVSVIVELPGVDKDEIDVKLEKDNLLVSVPGKFKKTIKVKNADPKSIEWRFKNGVLEINVKKRK